MTAPKKQTEKKPRGRTALLLGATGLVGSACLDFLLADRGYRQVRVLARSALKKEHKKLIYHRVEFESLDDAQQQFAVDDIFCCLGTTIKVAGSQQAFRRVDFDYPITAAKLGAEAAAERFLVVSAVGADPRSRVFYNRVKGEMEEALKKVPYRAIWILRPSLLLGERTARRPGEGLATAISRPLTPLMVGPLRRYRPIPAEDVARAMVKLAKKAGRGGVVENEEIARIARE